jgi:signal transduction histidine kinase
MKRGSFVLSHQPRRPCGDTTYGSRSKAWINACYWPGGLFKSAPDPARQIRNTTGPIGRSRALDEAIASAVTIYGRESQQSRLDDATDVDHERMGFFVHELRNLVNTATVAFEVLKTGNVGVAGSTGAVLKRSLMGLHDLIARSVDEVRLTQRVTNRTRLVVSEFIGEVAAAARLAASARGITLIVPPLQVGLVIEADPQVLAAVVGNLPQNAFKFTRPHSTVTLTVGASADRVLPPRLGHRPRPIRPRHLPDHAHRGARPPQRRCRSTVSGPRLNSLRESRARARARIEGEHWVTRPRLDPDPREVGGMRSLTMVHP